MALGFKENKTIFTLINNFNYLIFHYVDYVYVISNVNL